MYKSSQLTDLRKTNKCDPRSPYYFNLNRAQHNAIHGSQQSRLRTIIGKLLIVIGALGFLLSVLGIAAIRIGQQHCSFTRPLSKSKPYHRGKLALGMGSVSRLTRDSNVSDDAGAKDSGMRNEKNGVEMF